MNDSPWRRTALIALWLLAIPGFVMLALALFVLSGLPEMAGCSFNILWASLVHCPNSDVGRLVEPLARRGYSVLLLLPLGTAVPLLYSIGFLIWRAVARLRRGR
jgi:hypothetical protein